MEEKKKRWRPSLTAYRELEKEVKELKQYQRGDTVPVERFREIESKNVTLEKSNKWLQDRLKAAEKGCENLREIVARKDAEIARLENRSLLDRILNR